MEAQFDWLRTFVTTSAPRPSTTKHPADLAALCIGFDLQLQQLVDPHTILAREGVQRLRHHLRVGGYKRVAVGLELAHALHADPQRRELLFGYPAGLLQLRELGAQLL